MSWVIGIVGTISLLLGIVSLLNYIRIATVLPRMKVTYTGQVFWLVAFVCLVVLYLKGG